MFKIGIKKSKEKLPELSNKDKLDIAKQNNTNLKEKIKSKRRKLYIITIISVLVVLVIVTFLIIYLNNLKYKPYLKYEEKMKTYGFDLMYDNKSAKTSETVTKSEAIKLALSAVFNTNDISEFAAENNDYENAIWTQYAKDKGITTEDINSSNYNDKVKYVDVISYFENCKMKFLTDESIDDTDVSLKDINKYTTDQQTAIKDMIANEIISKTLKKLNGNSYIFKGQLNEIVVNFVEKYNTITINGDKININPDKIPSNADKYPYTLSSVDKTVYEIENYIASPEKLKSAKEIFSYKKEEFYRIQDIVTKYLNTMLNVDYENFDKEQFKKDINDISLFNIPDTKYNEYFDYVLANKIKITGSAKLQFPAVYYDGTVYRARTKIEYEITSCNKYENILFYDNASSNPVQYKAGKVELIIDIPVSTYYNIPQLAIYVGNLNDYIAGKVNQSVNEGTEKTIDENEGGSLQ